MARTTKRETRKVRDWDGVIEKLNTKGKLRIKMGSPGSAQVTRCRILDSYNGIEATTQGATLHLAVAGA